MVNNETQPDLQSHPLFGCNLLSSGPWLVDLRPRYLRALSSSTPRGCGSIRAGQGSVIAFSRCCLWPINLSFFPLKNQGKSIHFGHLSHQVPSHSQATSASCVRSCIHTRSRRNIAKTRRGTKRSSGLFAVLGLQSLKFPVSLTSAVTIRDADPFLDSCGKPNDTW